MGSYARSVLEQTRKRNSMLTLEQQKALHPPLTHVACIDANGRIWSLPKPLRHHNVLHVMAQFGAKLNAERISSQGFLDLDGTYLNRTQAMVNAEINNQIKNGKIIDIRRPLVI